MAEATNPGPTELQDGVDVDVVCDDVDQLHDGMTSLMYGSLFLAIANQTVSEWSRWSPALFFVGRGLYLLATHRRRLGAQRVRVQNELVEIGSQEGFSKLDFKSWSLAKRRLTIVCRGIRYRLMLPLGGESELLARLTTVTRVPPAEESVVAPRALCVVVLVVGSGIVGIGAALGETSWTIGGLGVAAIGAAALMAHQRQKAKLPDALK